MKVISNKTQKPLKVPLPGGKFLYLGPAKTGQISERSSEQPAVQRLVKSGDVEILGEGESPLQAGGGRGGAAHNTHGHMSGKAFRPKGDR